ncbi:MAG: hypothetical protein R8K20_06060 [Gallionellaceae bacterium]
MTKALAGRDMPLCCYEIHVENGRFELRLGEIDLHELSRYMPKTAQSGVEMFSEVNAK